MHSSSGLKMSPALFSDDGQDMVDFFGGQENLKNRKARKQNEDYGAIIDYVQKILMAILECVDVMMKGRDDNCFVNLENLQRF